VDHGVETPELRQQAGKDPRGTIRLSATHEANHIVLRIQDDGKGMDPVKLKQKAVERGILSAADAERMEDTEAYNLIFLPGFSMAQAITSVSGRGVGMDVVRTNITRLNGTIDLESVLGQGTTITIRLPLTLAIISGLQVGAAGEIFIVPLTAVIEALRISQDQVENLQGRQVILARDKVLPLINLAQVLQVPAAKSEKNEAYVVVTGLAERRMGILVDRLLGQVDVVIKALGDFVGPAQGIAGATILGDGRVRLILDVGKLMDLQERYREVG
jgi:two-component system chemotaxis sensor kinase CheA